jgi:uncharacterized membrane protein
MNIGRDASRLEEQIGAVLRLGTIASSALFAVGLVMTLAGYGNGIARAVLALALMILLGTPVARVIVSVVEYVRERDWPFVAVTMIVLLALAASVAAAYL